MTPTIRASKQTFPPMLLCVFKILSTHMWGASSSSVYEMHVCIIDMDGSQLVAGRDSWQLPSAVLLCSAPSPARVSEDCTVNTHQLRPNCRHRRTLALRCKRTSSSASPGPGNLAGNQRLSVTYVVTRPADPGHQPLSGRHHVHPLRHLDGRFLQGRRDAIVS